MRHTNDIDIGNGVHIRWVRWAPDRELNPQYEGIPDDPHSMLIVGHVHPDGKDCEGGIMLDTEVHRRIVQINAAEGQRPVWTIESMDPLTLSPSILFPVEKGGCGLHGFIREGRWVPA